MAAKVFHVLTSPDNVLEVLERYVSLSPKGVEEVDLTNALWRVLADDVYALVDVPPFDRSEVDGYAIVSSSVIGADEDNPIKLRVIGTSSIGRPFQGTVHVGEAVEIDTGAVIPRGSDAVVMVEYCKRVGEYVYVYKSVAPGENVAFAGSDVMVGDLVLLKGTLITPRELSLLSALGVGRVRVYMRPRVALISIGTELKSPGDVLGYGEVYDVNTYSIASLLRELHIEPKIYGIVGDEFKELHDLMLRALEECDVVITSGGTSAGPTDLTYRVIDALGKPGVLIHGLKVRPGKPTVIGVVNGKLVIGLPGFPLSAVMAFIVVVRPILAKLLGLRTLVDSKVRAVLAERVVGGRGVEHLIPVAVVGDGEVKAYPVPYASGMISVFSRADGFIRVPENVGVLEKGSYVDVYLFGSSLRPADLVFIGSHDYGVSLAMKLLKSTSQVKVINVGSLAGLLAIRDGEADIAGIHLLDEESGEYNKPYLVKLGLSKDVILIKGYMRKVGLIVKPGNPKNIRSIEDLLRSDVVFINRNKGSGTRTFLDILIKALAAKLGKDFHEVVRSIRGYTTEAKTHSAVAAAVAQGRADVGLGIEAAARLYGLDFIELHREHYDFVARKDRITKPSVLEFINILKSSEFRKELSKLHGYDVPEDIGGIIEL